ncbi:MAG: aminotransferase class I/II-fold pyridoxal phosphate-dependent enzyme [Limisphaerales bacterium]
MAGFEEELRARLESLESQNLRRALRRIASPQQPRSRIAGREIINFSSNDYLGLATHPRLREAAAIALRDYGTGSGASRLISGSLDPHHHLEESLAAFKGTGRALVFSTGYATALGAITALISAGDIIILDKLVHASIVDGARLSGAKLRIFGHNDLHDLESILQWSETRRSANPNIQILIVTESLFSMDGDIAPLSAIVELKNRFGAWLMVDEAHATGLFGPNRRGLIDEFGLTSQVEIQMGTLGKALGSAGGYIAGSAVLIDYLINKARSFIFSTAPPPGVAAASSAALELLRSAEGAELLGRLRANIHQFSSETGTKPPAENSPIVPMLIGAEDEALKVSAALFEAGFLVPAIRYPTVARNQARLRFTFSAAHTADEISALSSALRRTR